MLNAPITANNAPKNSESTIAMQTPVRNIIAISLILIFILFLL